MRAPPAVARRALRAGLLLVGAAASSGLRAGDAPGAAAAFDASPSLPARSAPVQLQEWWLDLSVPSPATVHPDSRPAQLARVQAQQAEVMAQVVQRGGVVVGQVTRVRNALAVRIAASEVDTLRRIPGVRTLRPVLHQHKPMREP